MTAEQTVCTCRFFIDWQVFHFVDWQVSHFVDWQVSHFVHWQVSHWHCPQFHAYFPTGNSYPAIVADMLSDAIGCIGFSWVCNPLLLRTVTSTTLPSEQTLCVFAYGHSMHVLTSLVQISSPACTELEVVMMDWLAKILNLPEQFMSGGKGGGVIQVSDWNFQQCDFIPYTTKMAKCIEQTIFSLRYGQGTASEATLVGLLAARSRTIQSEKNANPSVTSADVMNRLVCYCSDQVRPMSKPPFIDVGIR